MNISFRLPTVAAVAAFAVLLGAGSAKASTIVVGDKVTFAHGLYGTTGGGEFTVTDITNPQSITTFCLQMTEHVDYSTTFTVGGITKYATWEGTATGGDGTGKDYISPETAYLYTQFSLGTAGFVPNSDGSADNFQRAIWMFENEIAVDGSNPFYTAANAAVAGGWTGTGDVYVLNLFYPNGTGAQDQLVWIPPTTRDVNPVPEPATLSLLGLGLAGIARSIRKRQ